MTGHNNYNVSRHMASCWMVAERIHGYQASTRDTGPSGPTTTDTRA